MIAGIVVDQNQALRFAIDIAQGMEFLHTLEPPIQNLHLNSKHVMVGSLPFFAITHYQIHFPFSSEASHD